MCLLQFDLSEKSLVQTPQLNPVEVDRTSSLTPARGHTLDTLDMSNHFQNMTGDSLCSTALS